MITVEEASRIALAKSSGTATVEEALRYAQWEATEAAKASEPNPADSFHAGCCASRCESAISYALKRLDETVAKAVDTTELPKWLYRMDGLAAELSIGASVLHVWQSPDGHWLARHNKTSVGGKWDTMEEAQKAVRHRAENDFEYSAHQLRLVLP